MKSEALDNFTPRAGREPANWPFTERRLGVCASGWVLGYMLILSLGLLPNDEWVRCIDFGRIWLSGGFAVSDDPVRVYDFAAFSAAQLRLFGSGYCPLFYHFPYPPTFLFFTFPLGMMPYSVAFPVWITVMLLLYPAAIYPTISRPTAVIAAQMLYPVVWNVRHGQNAFHTAGLVGLSLVIIRHSPDSRPVKRDFSSHRGTPQRNSAATNLVGSQIVRFLASQGRNVAWPSSRHTTAFVVCLI